MTTSTVILEDRQHLKVMEGNNKLMELHSSLKDMASNREEATALNVNHIHKTHSQRRSASLCTTHSPTRPRPR